jgi:hypothetical protein
MKITVDTFQGMAPRLADYQLDQQQASFAANLKITNGALRGFRSLELLDDLEPAGADYKRAVKMYYPGSDNFEWWTSNYKDAAVLQSPIANDGHNRVYYTEPGGAGMQVTTLALLDSGGAPHDVGIARPTTAPTVSATGGTGPTSVRAYVYTVVSIYGSESAPSPATITTGKEDSTWTIGALPTAPNTFLQWTDVYRSAAGQQSSGNYYRVKRVAYGTASTTDPMASDLVPLQPPLDSVDNDPPPSGLQGIVLHSSGAVAGYVGRDVYFSRPYLPHAWPGATKYTMPYEVVGLAAIANSIIVMTKGHPVALMGTFPDAMGIANLTDAEPCLAHRSIVISNNTVYYASANGLVSVSAGGPGRPTNAILTREEWPRFEPEDIIAATHGSYYVAFTQPSTGFAITLPPYEPISLTVLDRYNNVTGVETDTRSGGLHVITGDQVWRFDQLDDTRFATTWRSKEFIMPKPINMGAVQIIFGHGDGDAAYIAQLTAALRAYNELVFTTAPLNTLNMYPLNGRGPAGPAAPAIRPGVPPQMPLGGQGMYDIDAILAGRGVRFTLIGDGLQRYSQLLTRPTVYTLPAGYKATRLYAELSGAVEVQRLIIAETRRECRDA